MKKILFSENNNKIKDVTLISAKINKMKDYQRNFNKLKIYEKKQNDNHKDKFDFYILQSKEKNLYTK